MRLWLEHANGHKAPPGARGIRVFPDLAHYCVDVTDRPAETVVANRPIRLVLEHTGEPLMLDPAKPAFRIPAMAEIRALPWNGRKVISTFAGCGGSSLGYRMAGFKIAAAVEFIPAAAEVYRLNAGEGTVVVERDIRQVEAAELLELTGLAVGELDVLDGSPPCASFSSAGKREKAWGTVKKYSDGEQRSDDLFFEFARLVAGLRPKVFVAENVSGLVKGAAKGYFLEILARLKACGYRVEARLLDAQWLGVPQARERLIFVGVREDLGLAPVHPKPLGYRYGVREAIADVMAPIEPEADLEGYAVGEAWDETPIGGSSERYFSLKRPDPERPSQTIAARGGAAGVAGVTHPTEKRRFSIAELRRISGFPDDFALSGTYAQQWERLGRAVPPVMMAAIAAAVRDEILAKIE